MNVEAFCKLYSRKGEFRLIAHRLKSVDIGAAGKRLAGFIHERATFSRNIDLSVDSPPT